jgi:hypothetical protein
VSGHDLQNEDRQYLMEYDWRLSPRPAQSGAFALHSRICSQLASRLARGASLLPPYLYVCWSTKNMSAVFARAGLVPVMAIVALTLMAPGAPARADTITVALDRALVVRLPENVATIIIGNPLIADATLQHGGVLIVTGKGYGETNMMALDRNGRVVLDNTVEVLAPQSDNLVYVYKGVDRESYSCTPKCERRVTLGDSPVFFGQTLSQIGARNGAALAGGAGGGGSAPQR